jgi:hypothetical protein
LYLEWYPGKCEIRIPEEVWWRNLPTSWECGNVEPWCACLPNSLWSRSIEYQGDATLPQLMCGRSPPTWWHSHCPVLEHWFEADILAQSWNEWPRLCLEGNR